MRIGKKVFVLDRLIGRGAFGVIRVGHYKGEKIAMKRCAISDKAGVNELRQEVRISLHNALDAAGENSGPDRKARKARGDPRF